MNTEQNTENEVVTKEEPQAKPVKTRKARAKAVSTSKVSGEAPKKRKPRQPKVVAPTVVLDSTPDNNQDVKEVYLGPDTDKAVAETSYVDETLFGSLKKVFWSFTSEERWLVSLLLVFLLIVTIIACTGYQFSFLTGVLVGLEIAYIFVYVKEFADRLNLRLNAVRVARRLKTVIDKMKNLSDS